MGHILSRLSAGPLVSPTLSSPFSSTPCPVTFFFHESSQRAQRIGLSWTPRSRVHSSPPPALGITVYMRMRSGFTVLWTLCKGRETRPPNTSPVPSILPRHSFLDGARESTRQLHSSQHNPPCVISRHGKNLLLAIEENPRS